MIIALIVLSSILLFLIIGLIFKKDFREDILKAKAENEAEIKGVKIKGALFWVIYALTAIGTIYIAISLEKEEVVLKTKPILQADGPNWIALDLNTEKPTSLKYGYKDSLEILDPPVKALDLKLDLDENLKLKSVKSGYIFGEITAKSLAEQGFNNDLEINKFIEIQYNLVLNPVFTSKRDKRQFYNWNDYEDLPFTVTVNYSSERGVHILITSKKQDIDLHITPKTVSEKWSVITPPIDGKNYIIHLREVDTNPNNGPGRPELANLQILQLSSKVSQ